MKTLIATLAIASLALSAAVNAQTADPKLQWATKAVALQQGPELERLVGQLADSATQDILQNWGPKLQSNVPPAKREQAKEGLNAELKKYFEDVSKTINSKVSKVSSSALIPSYMERFSLDELKQLVAFFESPAVRKYQSAAPELGSLFVKKLIEETNTDVMARTRQFDDAATKIVGAGPANKAPIAAPNSDKSKPPAKK
ncbi:MAG: DUF2059 domain-containing protein [Polaromonas sp.]|jgi:hypothetical protein